jgi:hypothetical protein
MRRIKRSAAFYLATTAICFLFLVGFKFNVSAYNIYFYLNGDGGSFTLNMKTDVVANYDNDYDVLLIDRKGKVIKTAFADGSWGSATATIGGLQKNRVYYYQTRQKYWNPDTSSWVLGEWSARFPFTTIRGGQYKLKIKSKKNRTVSLKVPKIKGVSSYNVYLSLLSGSGYKKVKTVKPGKTVVLKGFNGGKFAWNWVYFAAVIPKVNGKEAQGMVAKGSFKFTKTYKIRYRRYRIIYYRRY